MNYTTLILSGAASVTATVMAELARRGRPKALAPAAPWLFLAAGLSASTGVLYLTQLAYPGDPDIYTLFRVALAAAMVGTMVRIARLLRSSTA